MTRYLKTTPDILKCPDAACSYAFISSEPSCSEFNCINCNKKYCLSCKQPSHEGQCVFEKLFASLNYRQMQKMWVEQDGGCKYVTCRCGFQFCISCGMECGKCGCEPGHTFYSVGAVLNNFQRTITCQCRYNKSDAICVCK